MVDFTSLMLLAPPIAWGVSSILGLLDTRVAAWLSSAASIVCIILGASILLGVQDTPLLASLGVIKLGPITWTPILETGALGASFLIALGVCCLACSALTNYYWGINGEKPPRGYSCILYVSMASMYMVLLSRDLITLLVFWEAMSFSLGLLIMYEGGIEGRRASIFYLILMHATSLPMLVSFAWVISRGASSYVSLAQLPVQVKHVLTASILVAFTAKSGLFPFYAWLPPAHSRAPSDASVVLSGFSVKPPVYQGLILCSVLEAGRGTGLILLAQSLASVVIGCIGALWSRQGKRVLAYTTVVYMGLAWMIVSLLLLGCHPLLLTALAVLVIAHSVYKSASFATVGLCKKLWGSDDFDKMGGLCGPGSSMCALASLTAASMLPVPPFIRFLGELGVLLTTAYAVILSPHPKPLLGFVVVVLISSIAVTLGYSRVLSSILSPITVVKRASSSLGLRVLEALVIVSPVFLCVCASPILSGRIEVLLYIVVVACIILGLAFSRYMRTPKEESWVSGEVTAWPALSGLQPLSVKPPRKPIEYYLLKPQLPKVREVTYAPAYYWFSKIIARLISKLVWPSVRGGVLMYMSIMLAFFLALLVASVFVGVS